MCSIGEDDFGDEGGLHAMIKDVKIMDPVEEEKKFCKKCEKENVLAEIKMAFREAECEDCFLAYVRHKFRASLGSSKILPKGAKVLLVFDKTPASHILLDMLHYAHTQNTFKRLHCDTKVLLIDESSIISPQIFGKMKSLVAQYSFPTFVVNVSSTGGCPQTLEDYSPDSQKSEEWITNFGNIKSDSSRADFLEVHKRQLIEKVANSIDCNFVFLSNISLDLATTLLTNVALGRGASVANDVALVDRRIEGLTIIRPLKDLTQEEVTMYVKVRRLATVSWDNSTENSIQSLTKLFVDNLQKDYSSTVSTVFRTGGKIAPKSNDRFCELCRSPLDFMGSETLCATEFSRIVSELANQENVTESVEKLLDKAKDQVDNNLDTNKLCHGCRNIYSDCLDKSLFS